MAKGGELETLKDWGSKLPGTVARVAAVLHAAKHAHQVPLLPEVQTEEMQAAVRLGRLLVPHARKAFDLMQADENRENARLLLGWIERSRKESFTVREARRSNSKRFPPNPVIPALKLLELHDFIRELDVKPEKAGRPSPAYEVNPCLLT